MACSSMWRPGDCERSSCGGKEAHGPSDFVVGPADRIVGAAPVDKRAGAADLKNIANPADHDSTAVAVDDFLAFAFERGDCVDRSTTPLAAVTQLPSKSFELASTKAPRPKRSAISAWLAARTLTPNGA